MQRSGQGWGLGGCLSPQLSWKQFVPRSEDRWVCRCLRSQARPPLSLTTSCPEVQPGRWDRAPIYQLAMPFLAQKCFRLLRKCIHFKKPKAQRVPVCTSLFGGASWGGGLCGSFQMADSVAGMKPEALRLRAS